MTKDVLARYQQLLDSSSRLVDEGQMRRVSQMLANSQRVYIYGMGSSGFAAREFALRLMRTGLLVEAITDSHMIRMNAVLVDETVTVVAITLSGATEEVLWGVREARRRGARVVLMTASQDPQVLAQAEEVLPVASEEYLSAGLRISPQFPHPCDDRPVFRLLPGQQRVFQPGALPAHHAGHAGEDPKGRERKG